MSVHDKSAQTSPGAIAMQWARMNLGCVLCWQDL